LTLVVVPTVYELLDNMRTRVLRMVGIKPPRTGEHRTYSAGEPVPMIGD
jgi:HAE1 family hydrophobic/amphiphilic exporter-1